MPYKLLSTSRLYDRNFVLAMTSQTCFVIANTLLTHYARWVDFLGGGVRQVGWIMGIGAVLGLLLRPWMGQWINRVGSRTMWLIGYGVFATAAFANLLLDGLGPAIYLLRSSLVLGAAIVFASSLTYITQVSPTDRRTEAIGILGAGGFIGMLIGPLLGDLILGSGVRDHQDFVILFLTAGIASLVPAILLCFLRTPAGNAGSGAVRLRDFLRTTRAHWPGGIVLVGVVFGVCMTAPFVFLTSYVDQLPLTIPGVSVVGLFFWCYAGWGLIVRVALRRTPDRLGRRKVLLAGMLCMSVGMFLYEWVDAQSPWMIVLPALVTGMAHALMFHTIMSLTIESFPENVRGTGSALALMTLDFGMIAGAPLMGWIADAYGFDWMFATMGLMTLLVAVAYAYWSLPIWQSRHRLRQQQRETCGTMGSATAASAECITNPYSDPYSDESARSSAAS